MNKGLDDPKLIRYWNNIIIHY